MGEASESAVIELTEADGKDEERELLSKRAAASGVTLDGEREGVLPASQYGPWTKDARSWVLAGIAILALCAALVLLLLQIGADWFKPKPSARFFVIGDWGRDGFLNQSLVAQAMANKAATFRPEFIVSVGDNMYESGLTSTHDEQFTTSFTSVYSHGSLQVPWHAILGNHDYGEFWSAEERLAKCPDNSTDCFLSPLHQLSAELTARDWRWHCERWFQLPALDGRAELFFIDTNPFISAYHSAPWAGNKGGILEQSWESQLLELEARLAQSTAEWKLVFGHHPVRNNHLPQNTEELVQHLEPILEAQGVQAYFSGHEHNLQYIHVENASTHYLVSGGGSKTDYFPAAYWDNGGSLFQHQGSGFVACLLTEKSLECDFLGTASLEPLLTASIKRA